MDSPSTKRHTDCALGEGSDSHRTFQAASGVPLSKEQRSYEDALRIKRCSPVPPYQSDSEVLPPATIHDNSEALLPTPQDRAYHYSCGDYSSPVSHVIGDLTKRNNTAMSPVSTNDWNTYNHTIIDLQTPRDIDFGNPKSSSVILKSVSIDPATAAHQMPQSDALCNQRLLRHRRGVRHTPTTSQESLCSTKGRFGVSIDARSISLTADEKLESTENLSRPLNNGHSYSYAIAQRKRSFSSTRTNLPPSIKTEEPVFHASVTEVSPSILDKGDHKDSKEVFLDPEEEARFSWDAEEQTSEGIEDKKKKQRPTGAAVGGTADEVCCSHLVRFFPRWVLWILMNLLLFALLMIPVFLHRKFRIQGAFILNGTGSTYTVCILGFHVGYYGVQVLMKGVWRLILFSSTRAIRMKISGYKVHIPSIGRCIWLSITIICWFVFMEVPMCTLARDAHLFEAEGAEERACRIWGLWWVRQVLVGFLASTCLYIVKTAIVRGIWAHFGQATYMERLETALYHDAILAKISAFDGVHGIRRRIPSADTRIRSTGGALEATQNRQQVMTPGCRQMVTRMQEVALRIWKKTCHLFRALARSFHPVRSLFSASISADSLTDTPAGDHRDSKDHPKNKLNITRLLKKHGATNKARILFEKICPSSRIYLLPSDFQALFTMVPEVVEYDDKLTRKVSDHRDGADKSGDFSAPSEPKIADVKHEPGAESPKDAPPWEKAWQVFDPTNRGIVTRSMFKKTVLSIKRECRNLTLSYTDLSNAIGKLEILVNTIFAFLVIVAFLAAFEVSVVHTFTVSISSLVLGCAFVTGSSAKNAFESMIFLFIMRPFDVGDRIEMDGAFYTIVAIHIMTTQLKRGDGLAVFAPNYVLATRFINNMTRSADHVDNISMDVPLFTTARTIQQLKQRISAFTEGEGSNDYIKIDVILNALNNHTKEGHSRACLQILFRVFHRGKWVDSQYVPRKTRAILFLREILNELEQEDLKDLLELRRSLGCSDDDPESPITVNESGQEMSQDFGGSMESSEKSCYAQLQLATNGCNHGVTHSEGQILAYSGSHEQLPVGTADPSQPPCIGATWPSKTGKHPVAAAGTVEPPLGYVTQGQASTCENAQQQQQQQVKRHALTTRRMHPRQPFIQEAIQLSTVSANIQPFPNGFLSQR